MKTVYAISFIFLLLLGSATGLDAQGIHGLSSRKYVNLQKKKVVLPTVTWKYPATDYSTTNKTHNLEVCIASKEKPTVVLYVDRVRQNNRNFKLTPIKNGCDYTWKLRMTFSRLGKYFLEIEATNSAGKVTKSRILEIKDGVSPPPPPAGRRLALVIGNAAYSKKSLTNPTNDAYDMTKKLQSLGFSVDKYTNLNRRSMIKAVDNFCQKIQKGDIALFFYAGHGYQIDGISYLLPIGAIANILSEADAEDEGYRVGRVLRNMESAGASANLVFLDACRDNPVRSVFRTVSRSAASRGLNFPNKTPSGFLIAFATAAGGIASDGSGRNGTYTAALLKFMERGNSITDILTMVNGAVKQQTNQLQTPEYKVSLDNIFKF